MLDGTFIGIYTIEFACKFYARPRLYWTNYFNVFDFIILALSLFEMFASVFSRGFDHIDVVRIFRVFRALRALRTVSFVRGLQVLMTALVETLKKSVLSIIFLLVMVIFLFAIFGIYMFGDEGAVTAGLFSDLGEAMLTLLTMVRCRAFSSLYLNASLRGGGRGHAP